MIGASAVLILAVIALVIYVLGKAGGQFDTQDSTAQSATSADASINAFADAIGAAEGFGLPGAIPTVAHNPGDLVLPGWTGPTLGAGISVFTSDADGRARLIHQLLLIQNGQSKVYSLSDSISAMAAKWTTTDQTAWANIVSENLGVTPDTTIGEILSQ